MDTPAYKELLDSALTLRDYFAARALVPLLHKGYPIESIAVWAYKYADAMLAERAKK